MSVEKPKPNTQTSVSVNEEASAELRMLRREQERFLRIVDNTLGGIGDDLDSLRHRVRNALDVLRGFPEYLRKEDLPEDCPGWGRYGAASSCASCRWNLECLIATDQR